MGVNHTEIRVILLTFLCIDFMTAIVGVTTDFARQLKEI